MDLPAGYPPKPPRSFTRSELVRAIYERFATHSEEGQGPRLKQRVEAQRLATSLLEEIASALERGMRVELRGLGAFDIKEKRERQGRNPRTGEAVIIDARRVVRFRTSGLLHARLNRRINRRPQRSKADPRQLVFPIDEPKAEQPDMGPATTPPLSTGAGKADRKGAAYEKGE